MKLFSIQNVRKKYAHTQSAGGELSVLGNVSLKISKGEFVGIIGPNGCGKTTLFRLIIGFEKPNGGLISVFGKEPEETRIGFVPQHTAGSLFPWFTAQQNIAFAFPTGTENAEQLALEKLEAFGIQHYSGFFPYQLSGGMKQLVAIARATIGSDVFLFDEPLNGLDYQNKLLVENAFLRLKDGKNTALLVSHDIESAILLCDKIVILSEKPSQIKAVISVSLPANRTAETRFSPAFTLILRQVFKALHGA